MTRFAWIAWDRILDDLTWIGLDRMVWIELDWIVWIGYDMPGAVMVQQISTRALTHSEGTYKEPLGPWALGPPRPQPRPRDPGPFICGYCHRIVALWPYYSLVCPYYPIAGAVVLLSLGVARKDQTV